MSDHLLRTRYTIRTDNPGGPSSTIDPAVAQYFSERGGRVTAEREVVDLAGHRTTQVSVEALMEEGDPR